MGEKNSPSIDAAFARDCLIAAAREAGAIALGYFRAGEQTSARVDYKAGGSPELQVAGREAALGYLRGESLAAAALAGAGSHLLRTCVDPDLDPAARATAATFMVTAQFERRDQPVAFFYDSPLSTPGKEAKVSSSGSGSSRLSARLPTTKPRPLPPST